MVGHSPLPFPKNYPGMLLFHPNSMFHFNDTECKMSQDPCLQLRTDRLIIARGSNSVRTSCGNMSREGSTNFVREPKVLQGRGTSPGVVTLAFLGRVNLWIIHNKRSFSKLFVGILQQPNLVQSTSEFSRLACNLINASVQAYRGALADPPRRCRHAES